MKKIATSLMLMVFTICVEPVCAEQETTLHEAMQKAVLITGASTGIGRHAAEQLAKAGYFIYAGARTVNRDDG
jgi:NADPH:quinone reductase-like Zn-dependent oxidoreductase